MIIPIKCFTCGNVLADKYRFYLEKVRAQKLHDKQSLDAVVYLTREKIANHEVEKTIEGQTLDSLGLVNACCRRHMLTHVDIE
jgi:DNA-directed RNA polymerase I, II, and III subunit RPABC5